MIEPMRMAGLETKSWDGATDGGSGKVEPAYRHRMKMASLEVSLAIPDFDGLSGYAHLGLLLRWRGRPFGFLKAPVFGDRLSREEIAGLICSAHAAGFAKALAREWLELGVPTGERQLSELLQRIPSSPEVIALPTITVAVCTRDRANDLELCLESILRLIHQPLEVLVIDNAPATDTTRKLVEEKYPTVRYIIEPRPGLDWARNRAIGEARGDVLAFTDDDVVLDSLWTQALGRLFASDSEVMAVTGLVAPFEIETEAQAIFEAYGGFGRGYERRWYRLAGRDLRRVAKSHAGTGKFGTGANMAYRRSVFAEIGLFDPALDVGTVANGGGDIDMFFRVLKHGHCLVYEPAAVVWHRHRRGMDKLLLQMTNNGNGLFSYLNKIALVYPEERRGVLKFVLWWFRIWVVRRLISSLYWPRFSTTRALAWSEFMGCLRGMFRYSKAQVQANSVKRRFGDPEYSNAPKPVPRPAAEEVGGGIAIRQIDVCKPITPIEDISAYGRVRLFLSCRGEMLGEMSVANSGKPLSAPRLGDAICDEFGFYSFNPFMQEAGIESERELVFEALRAAAPVRYNRGRPLEDSVSASIVIAAQDRPDLLRVCLTSLQQQLSRRSVEIIVVDTNPASGRTEPVVRAFDGVGLVKALRGEVSCARSAGFATAKGEILIFVNDDATFPAGWLEASLAPFSRNDVAVVAGNVLPLQLESSAEIQFEVHSGLGKGYRYREFDRRWFESFRRGAAPIWTIGTSANVAVRASVLGETGIGLFDLSLRPGTTTGVGKDSFLFYKTLRAGYTIVYDPRSYVWRQPCTKAEGLKKQIWKRSKGHAAYNFATFLNEGDCRGLYRIFVEIPKSHLRQLVRWIRGSRYPSLQTIAVEIIGNVVGPLAFLLSRWRSKMFRRSKSSGGLQNLGGQRCDE